LFTLARFVVMAWKPQAMLASAKARREEAWNSVTNDVAQRKCLRGLFKKWYSRRLSGIQALALARSGPAFSERASRWGVRFHI